MCNIGKESGLESKMVYKVVVEVDGKYYGMFAGAPVKVGDVEQQGDNVGPNFIKYYRGMTGYNQYMVGRCTGFEKLSDAVSLMQCWKGRRGSRVSRVLEIELSKTEMTIMEGTAGRMSGVSESAVVFAGPHIKSLRVIQTSSGTMRLRR